MIDNEDKRVKLTPELIDALVLSILKVGTVKDAVKLLPVDISPEWISERRKNDKDLDTKLTKAVFAYRAGTPETDIEKISLLDDILKSHLIEGEIEIIQQKDPETQEILSIVEKRKKRFDPRIWEIFHPKKSWSESSILMVTANQMQDITNDLSLMEDERRIILSWLSGWIQKTAVDLQKSGNQLKVLDKIS